MSRKRAGVSSQEYVADGEHRTETEVALAAGEDIARARVNGQTFTVVPGGRPYRITDEGAVESMEGFLPTPVSRRADAEFYDAASFIAYVNRFKDKGSIIFADRFGQNKKFTAVLDYHEDGKGSPRWGRHRAGLALRPTLSWQTWVPANKTPMNQTQFSQFLEDNIPDIAEPAGALIVEIARTLEAKKNVVFESNIERQTDGSFKFLYHEDVQGSAGRGNLKIPDKFTLLLQPFEGGEKFPVEARFRYRIGEGGKLSMWFDLVRVQDVLDKAFAAELEDIVAGVGDTPILFGPAPARSTAE